MIDIRTFMLVLAIGNMGFAMLMSGYARSGADNPALRLWRVAKLVQGMAHLLGWLLPVWPSGALPATLLSMTASTALVLGVLLEVAAYCRFFDSPRALRWLTPCGVAALMLLHGARLGGATPATLAVLLSLIMTLLTGLMSYMLLRQRHASALQRIVGFNDVLLCLAMSARTVSGLLPADVSWLSTDAAQSFVFLSGYVWMIVNSFGFLLLCKEKDDAKLARLATLDSLTGLINRRAFFEQTEHARQLALRQRRPVALMMLDIDYFKRINDRYGHAAGDTALCLFADTAMTTLRDHDIMGRLGGEEFGLVLPGTSMEGALQAAERLRAAVEAAPLSVGGQQVTLTVSIGVVMLDAAEHINAGLARADHALYTAKSAGRNRVETGEPARRFAAVGC